MVVVIEIEIEIKIKIEFDVIDYIDDNSSTELCTTRTSRYKTSFHITKNVLMRQSSTVYDRQHKEHYLFLFLRHDKNG